MLTNDAGSNPKWFFTCTTNGTLVFGLMNKEKESCYIQHPINIGEWYRITGVRDVSKNTISLYIGSHLVQTGQGVLDDVNSGGPVWAGEYTNMLFRGCMDDIVLWDRALSPDEIKGVNRLKKNIPPAAGRTKDLLRSKPRQVLPGLKIN